MVNPHYGNLLDRCDVGRPPLLPGTRAVCDSGAFQERDMLERMSASAALDRQLRLERRLQADGCGPDFRFEAVVTYDMLVGVDEALEDGKRVKRRGDVDSAETAVCETLDSACEYWRRRDDVAGAIAYAAQGATLRQYVGCVEALLCMMRPGRDWLALGGFCIIGMQPSLKPLFAEVCRAVAPLARRHGVRRVHTLGVTVDDAVVLAAQVFAAEDVEVSTDSSSIELNSTMGKEWREENMDRWEGASPWEHVHDVGEKYLNYHPRDLAMANIARYTEWLNSVGRLQTETAQPPRRPIAPYQATLW